MDEMNYRVYARYAVSGDADFCGVGACGDTATVRTTADAPYMVMTSTFAGADAYVDDGVSARIDVSARTEVEVNVWAGVDQDDPF